VWARATDKKGLTTGISSDCTVFNNSMEIEVWLRDNLKGHTYQLTHVSGRRSPDNPDIHVLYAPDDQHPDVLAAIHHLSRINAVCNQAGLP
jgi:hypothetical protein